MRCTHCGASDLQRIFTAFSIDGDPFCDQACKNVWNQQIDIAIFNLREQFSLRDIGQPYTESIPPENKPNWKRDGF